MKRGHVKRLSKVEDQQAAQPIAPARVEAAYQHFVKTGELPTYRRMAAAVTQRALRRNAEHERISAIERYCKDIDALFADVEATDDDDKLRRQLYGEAVNGEGMVKQAARGMLTVLARIGIDLTEPLPFEGSIDLPKFGSLGLHLLGWPECLIRAPYEDRASKLVARLEAVRECIHDEPEWEAQFDEAVTQLRVTGELPENEVIREAVLFNRDLHDLMADVVAADDGHIC